jgi:uncharacterized protein YodC (DUF2158 family)
METTFKIGDVVAFKANKDIKLVISGIGNDGFALLHYYDSTTNEFKKIEMPLVCFVKVEGED